MTMRFWLCSHLCCQNHNFSMNGASNGLFYRKLYLWQLYLKVEPCQHSHQTWAQVNLDPQFFVRYATIAEKYTSDWTIDCLWIGRRRKPWRYLQYIELEHDRFTIPHYFISPIDSKLVRIFLPHQSWSGHIPTIPTQIYDYDWNNQSTVQHSFLLNAMLQRLNSKIQFSKMFYSLHKNKLQLCSESVSTSASWQQNP